MGCCYSRVEREETVSRCKARKRYIKQLVKARQAFSAAHAMYIRSLRATGSALLQFADLESSLHLQHYHQRHHHHLPPLLPSPPPQQRALPPPPPPPMSQSSDTWTSSSATASSQMPSPPPPPPPPPSNWDFWDPFVPSPPTRSATEEEWEATTANTASEPPPPPVEAAASLAAPPSVVSGFSKDANSELAMVVSRSGKDLIEIIKELDEYFLRAADAGGVVSSLLEVPSSSFSNHSAGKVYNGGRSLSPLTWAWGSNVKLKGFGRLGEEMVVCDIAGGGFLSNGHCSTVERLCAWEKKLFHEVKNAETMKMEHVKKEGELRKLEMKRGDYVKTQKIKKEVEKLESRMVVASQAIEATSAEIIKLRESELFPQLLDLIKELMRMWRTMYECHQVQSHIVQQLKFLNAIPSTGSTSEIHRQSALQLEIEVQQWHLSFCNLVNSQRDYVQSLTGWLRLSLFQFSKAPLSQTRQESAIYSLCEEWNHSVDRVPDRVASEGIKSFLAVIHAIVVQHAEEYKQKKRSESACRELEKKAVELRSLENKYGPYSMCETPRSIRGRDLVAEKRAKVDVLKATAEEEKNKHQKAIGVTRAMTLSNLQMGFPHVFQAVTGFSSICMQAFESVYSQAKIDDQGQDVKGMLP